MNFNYRKKTKIDYSLLELKHIQSYIPLYKLLFKFKDEDFNKFELDTHHKIIKIIKRLDHNNIEVELSTGEKHQIFIKYSALLDPIKYLIGKYNYSKELFELPKLANKSHLKLINPYNNAYVDGLFSYVTSCLLHKYNFIHGLDFYGMNLANQIDFKVNIYDDFDYICSSSNFISNIDKYFKLDYKINDILKPTKPKLTIYDNINKIELNNIETITNNDTSLTILPLTIPNLKKFSDISNTVTTIDTNTINANTINTNTIDANIKDTHSSISSHKDCTESSISGCSSLLNNSENESEDESEEEPIYVHIKNFPINMICLEKCQDTLDNYMIHSDIDEEEWKAIFMQIIMILLTYQKLFKFTHNDLHTNNIMYIETKKEYIYYRYNNTYYKVPTFHKIWKLIDFGRAIYTVDGIRFASDSFFKNEDAYSQYNTEPFYEANKTRIEPNYSFDICRLGCSLYDFFIDDPKETLDPLQSLVSDWCHDDNNKNILYKKNGEERYPEFKLYKMIARLVNQHTPEKQLERDLFKSYIIPKKKISKKVTIMKIDEFKTLDSQ